MECLPAPPSSAQSHIESCTAQATENRWRSRPWRLLEEVRSIRIGRTLNG